MHTKNLLFIGGGNMSQAIVSGLIDANYPAHLITVIDHHAEKRAHFSQKFHIKEHDKIPAEISDVVILAVKPQAAKAACAQLKPLLQDRKILLLSIMAGITVQTLHAWLSENISIVRAMPNTPAFLKAGATGLFADKNITAEEKNIAEFLMSSVGIVAWVEEENHMDIITALSGSGPAYFFYFMQAMQDAAIAAGLPENIASTFTIQTALGAAQLAKKSDDALSDLRARVTSKGGTTQAALECFEKENLAAIIARAMQAAQNRAKELSG